jgi:hypothetical protein
MFSIKDLENKISVLEGKKELYESSLEEYKTELRIESSNVENYKKCIDLLKYISTINQDKIITLFQHTVSAGLKDIFDNSYEFKIEMKTRGNSSSCDFKIKCGIFPEWSDIILNHGKSVQDVISVILRIVLVKLLKNERQIVVLDEPGSGIEAERQIVFSKFLSEISHKFGIQLIVVSHSEELTLHADKVINIHGNI